MATTTRKKEEKKAIIKKEIEPSIKDTLSPDHLMSLETISRDVENSRLVMAIEEQSLANMELQLKLLSSNIEKQRQLVSSKAQKYEAMKQKYISFKKDIWPSYGFKENEPLSYNPLSGQIVRT